MPDGFRYGVGFELRSPTNRLELAFVRDRSEPEMTDCLPMQFGFPLEARSFHRDSRRDLYFELLAGLDVDST